MKTALKHSVVGFAVIAACLFVICAILFSQSTSRSLPRLVQRPLHPSIVKIKKPPNHTVSHRRRARLLVPKEMPIDFIDTPKAWVLEVATFSSAIEAERLETRLRLKKMDVYLRSSHQGGQRSIQVYVGPVIHQTDAERLSAILKKDFNITGMIKRYQP